MRFRYILIPLALCLALAPGSDSQSPLKLHFTALGFSIVAPRIGSWGSTFTAVQMYLPPTDQYGANVTVQLQSYGDSMDHYIKLSEQGFDQMKLQVVRMDRRSRDICVLEYKGQMGDRNLHFYAKAIMHSGTVYIATATATENQWDSEGDTLRNCVDSIALDSAGAPQP